MAATLGLALAFLAFDTEALASFNPLGFLFGKKQAAGQLKPEKTNEPLPELALTDCYALALQRSETVAIKKEEIERAKADFFRASSEALGGVNFIYSQTRQDARAGNGAGGNGSGVSGTFNAREREEGTFVISQPLFQGFKSLGALWGAGNLRGERTQEWRRAEQLLFLDVASAFFETLKLRKDAEILESIGTLFQERIGELIEREKIGRSRASEVATARARLKTNEADLARARGALKVSTHVLEFLTGTEMDPVRLQEDTDPKTAETVDVYLRDARRRPDVRASEQAERIAKRNLIVAQSPLWPQIELELNRYTQRQGFQSDVDWDALFKVDVPLFQGGEMFGKMKDAWSRLKQAKLSYSLALRQAELEVKEAFQNRTASREELKALEESVQASEENFRLQKEEYARNLVNNLDVLDALEAFETAKRNANRVHYDLKRHFWELRIASGRCCSYETGKDR